MPLKLFTISTLRHGTNDEVLSYNNLGEAVKQWTNVLGADTIPASKENNFYQTGWTRQNPTPTSTSPSSGTTKGRKGRPLGDLQNPHLEKIAPSTHSR